MSDMGETTTDRGRPFSELRDTGLLWLINRVVFHPRGYALSLSFDKASLEATGGASGGEATGWSLLGDGSEPWSMGPLPAELIAKGHKTEDELFALVQHLLAPAIQTRVVTVDDAGTIIDETVDL